MIISLSFKTTIKSDLNKLFLIISFFQCFVLNVNCILGVENAQDLLERQLSAAYKAFLNTSKPLPCENTKEESSMKEESFLSSQSSSAQKNEEMSSKQFNEKYEQENREQKIIFDLLIAHHEKSQQEIANLKKQLEEQQKKMQEYQIFEEQSKISNSSAKEEGNKYNKLKVLYDNLIELREKDSMKIDMLDKEVKQNAQNLELIETLKKSNNNLQQALHSAESQNTVFTEKYEVYKNFYESLEAYDLYEKELVRPLKHVTKDQVSEPWILTAKQNHAVHNLYGMHCTLSALQSSGKRDKSHLKKPS